MRDQVPESFEICCALVHYMADIEKALAPHHMVKAKAAMIKGTYDKEIIEKVRTQAPLECNPVQVCADAAGQWASNSKCG